VKSKWFAYMLLLVFGVQAQYRALSRSDRAEFERVYQAVKIAFYSEMNYTAIIKFVPELIARYESIMLDPSCKKIRPLFLDMAGLLAKARNSGIVDSLEHVIISKKKEGDNRELLKTYDEILPQMAPLDTLRFRSHQMYYNGLAISIAKNKTTDTYAFLSTLKYLEHSILDDVRVNVKDKFGDRVAQLSAAMNPDSIVAFQETYPGIRRDDMSALLDRSRAAMRQSLLRRPSMQGYLDYKRLFGDDKVLKEVIINQAFKCTLGTITDPASLREYVAQFPQEGPRLWNQLEDSLFARWSSNRNSLTTNNYFRLFPQGRYFPIIQDHVQSMQSFPSYSRNYYGRAEE